MCCFCLSMSKIVTFYYPSRLESFTCEKEKTLCCCCCLYLVIKRFPSTRTCKVFTDNIKIGSVAVLSGLCRNLIVFQKLFLRCWSPVCCAQSSQAFSKLFGNGCSCRTVCFLHQRLCMNERSAGPTVFEQGFGFPPTHVFILCSCRPRLLPLHCGRDLVLQRPRPQQLHLPLGDSSGTKGKNVDVSI